MTREEKCKLAIEKGYTYNPETGEIFGVRGNVINTKHNCGYINLVITYEKNKRFLLLGHHLAWYITYGEIVEYIDHIDRDRANNKIENLRSVSSFENNINRSNVKGYCFDKKRNKYEAYIQVKKKIFLGYFDTEAEAREAYLKAKEIYHKIENPLN